MIKEQVKEMIVMLREYEYKCKKEVFDDIEKECPSSIWAMLNEEAILPLKKRHLSTFQKEKEHN